MKDAKINQSTALLITKTIQDKLDKALLQAANKVRAFLVGRVKEEVSQPATPRIRVKRADGQIYYRCPTPASENAPPRKLSSMLRQKFTGKAQVIAGKGVITLGDNARAFPSKKYPKGFPYPKYHEVKDPSMKGSGKHQFIKPTIKKHAAKIRDILGEAFKTEF